MPELFRSWQSYRDFEASVRQARRYVYDAETQNFLGAVASTAASRVRIAQEDAGLWRAQLGCDTRPQEQDGFEYEIECPFAPDRMKPQRSILSEGRANPKGISYLYLATDKETAMAEVRPWLGSYVSAGLFRVCKDVRLVDCTDCKHFIPLKEPPPEERSEFVWTEIGRAFAKPVSRDDDLLDYVPTQIIAEVLRHAGFDGIYYASSLGCGRNVVLFDLDAADIEHCQLHVLEKVWHVFQEQGEYRDFSKKST